MRHFLITVAGVVAGLALFAALALALLVSALASLTADEDGAIGDVIVLNLDLRNELVDQPDGAFGLADERSVVDIVTALARAETDERVRGLFVRASETGMPPEQAEEIGAAIARFRASGRFAIAHAQGFESPAFTAYLSAAAADEIWLQASGAFVATGLAAHTPFLGGALDMIGAQAEFVRFEEYKTAPNILTESDYTAEHRESLASILEDVFASSLEAAAGWRGREPAALRALVEASPYSAEEALERGLVDRLGHVAQAREHALERAGADAALVEIDDYLDDADPPLERDNVIALILAHGEIVTGAGGGAFSDDDLMRSDTIAEAIIEAAEDEDVRAIVLRVESPGGSPTASDQIHDAVARARDAGRPVVASFASVAASGGYYLAAGADEILAQPTTLTGSIGVYGGKIVLDDTLQMMGVNLEPLAAGGDFTLAYSASRGFSEAQREAFRTMLAATYADFTAAVAEGRGMDEAAVLEVARGRVWTGAQARELGLVDAHGGLREAIERARALAGLGPDEETSVRRYPPARTLWEEIAKYLGVGVGAARSLARFEAVLSSPELRAILAAARRAEGGVSARADLPAIR